MRKIKITALLLAALMVLTAFVGCAKTDPAVEALDDELFPVEEDVLAADLHRAEAEAIPALFHNRVICIQCCFC